MSHSSDDENGAFETHLISSDGHQHYNRYTNVKVDDPTWSAENYRQYMIRTSLSDQTQEQVHRRYNDFEWLIKIL